jgi:hypothetical protein
MVVCYKLKKLARSFNFTFRYVDDVLSLNNSRFGNFVDRIYPIELEIKDTTDTDRSASYLHDLHLEIDSDGPTSGTYPWSFVTQIYHIGHKSWWRPYNFRSDDFYLTKRIPWFSSFLVMTYHRVCNYINTTGATSGAGTAYPSGTPEFKPGF